jgi:hypothetical protein
VEVQLEDHHNEASTAPHGRRRADGHLRKLEPVCHPPDTPQNLEQTRIAEPEHALGARIQRARQAMEET